MAGFAADQQIEYVPVVATTSGPMLISPLPEHRSAMALLEGQSGAGWSVAKDILTRAAILTVALHLAGLKSHAFRGALAGSLALQAFLIATTAEARYHGHVPAVPLPLPLQPAPQVVPLTGQWGWQR